MTAPQSGTRKLMGGAGAYIDDRFGSAGFFRRNAQKLFPDHWSFLLGEIALHSFVLLLLTGVFLTLFFEPSSQHVTYHGSYENLQGVEMSAAYIIARFFTIHVLLLPGILLALIIAHLMIMWHQKHSNYASKRSMENTVVGAPFYPYFLAKTSAFAFFVFGVAALLGALVQINPVWLYGPYNPAHVTADSQSDWYFGFLEGAVRLMPAWEYNFLGHTLTLSVVIPIVVPGLLLTGMLLYPFLEQWVTGDKRHHQLLDRPRNAPTRAGIGMAGIVYYGVLWAAAGNDVIAITFNLPLFATTWFLRVAFLVGPVVAFIVTKRICLGLQRRDRELLAHGVESGQVRRLPSGEFIEVAESPSEEQRALVESQEELPQIATRGVDSGGVPAPGSRGPVARLRAALNHFYTKDDIEVAPTEATARTERAPAETSSHVGDETNV